MKISSIRSKGDFECGCPVRRSSRRRAQDCHRRLCGCEFCIAGFRYGSFVLNLVSPQDSFDQTSRLAANRIVSAMTNFPELIGGSERLDIMLMEAAEGRIISKVGADGVSFCGVLPCEKYPTGLGIALKIEDGDG